MNENSYAPAPFWFLNHRLDKEELLRQLGLMKESGVSGFFIHPRAGLNTPYGSKEWFDCVRFIVEEAEKLGLKAWLYDEDPFPSGAAGGRLMLEDPLFCARNLCHRIVRPDEAGRYEADLGPVCVLLAVSYRRDSNGSVTDLRDVTEHIGMVRRHYHKSRWNSSYFCDWRADVPYPHYRAETFFPEMCLAFAEEPGREVCVVYTEEAVNDGKYGKSPDCLNEACTKRFLELTHERYQKLLGDKFGTVIPGIFTDEPVPGGALPWTPKLEAAFKEDHAYALRGRLWQLWLPAEGAGQLREDYWRTVNGLYEQNFLKPIADWCHENNILFTGHMPGEENPVYHPYSGGSAYTLMKYLDIPGFDILGNNLGNTERPSLLFGARSVSSAARQQGKKRILCEAFACNAFNFGPADMRRVTDWLFALGINWIVPHGFYYSYDGYRKYDAGKSFFFQDPYFRDFPYYAEYAGKAGEFLASCAPCGDTALVYPARRMTRFLPGDAKRAEALQRSCFSAVSRLYEGQIPFEIVDEAALDMGILKGDSVICGQRTYRNLVLVEDEDSREDWCERLKQAGVAVYTAGNDDDMEELGRCAARVALCGAHTERLLTDLLMQEDDRILFVFNNAEEETSFALEGDIFAYSIDCAAGGAVAYQNSWTLAGYDSVLLRISTKSLPLVEASVYPKSFAKLNFKAPEWEYVPEGAIISVSKWDVTVTSRGKAMQWEQVEACPVRELLGTELREITDLRRRPIFDQAPLIPSSYPAEAVYTSTFAWRMQEAVGECAYLVMEGSTLQGDWELDLNGIPVPKESFKKQRIYDVTNRVADITALLHDGKNTLRIHFAEAAEEDGIYSSVYLFEETDMNYA